VWFKGARRETLRLLHKQRGREELDEKNKQARNTKKKKTKKTFFLPWLETENMGSKFSSMTR